MACGTRSEMSYEPNANAAIEIACRVGRGAARDYATRVREVAPPQQEEFLGCFIVGLEETIAGMVPATGANVSQIVDFAIKAFVDEAALWPAESAIYHG
jgi:hypothetical protein